MIPASQATHRSIANALRPSAEPSDERLFDAPRNDPRVDALLRLTIDLLAEVEALRATVIAVLGEATRPKEHPYVRAYAETGLLTHAADGTDGLERLLARFYPERAGIGQRELVLLRRLGLGEEDLATYVERAERAEGVD